MSKAQMIKKLEEARENMINEMCICTREYSTRITDFKKNLLALHNDIAALKNAPFKIGQQVKFVYDGGWGSQVKEFIGKVYHIVQKGQVLPAKFAKMFKVPDTSNVSVNNDRIFIKCANGKFFSFTDSGRACESVYRLGVDAKTRKRIWLPMRIAPTIEAFSTNIYSKPISGTVSSRLSSKEPNISAIPRSAGIVINEVRL